MMQKTCGTRGSDVERVSVRLLDVDDDKTYYCKTFDGTEKDNPVGTKKKVAYKKTARGYDIRGLEHRGKTGR